MPDFKYSEVQTLQLQCSAIIMQLIFTKIITIDAP